MIQALSRVVDACRRRAPGVVALAFLAAAAAGFFSLRRVSINTDTSDLMSPNLPWRRAAAAMDRDFPQNIDLMAIVVDGATPDQTEDAASALARGLAAQPGLFRDVRSPGANDFFRREGLLFLPQADVQKYANSMIAAQPMLGTLAADPSPRGVFDALDLFAQGAAQGQADAKLLDRPFRAVARAVEAADAGRYQPLSWESLLSDRAPLPSELRRFVLARPVLDYRSVQPGRRAIDTVRSLAARLGLVPSRGVTVRITGPVALNDEQFAALKEGAGLAAAGSFILLIFWLSLAVRSFRAVVAIILTLLTGLLFCLAFAVGAIGPFNPLSIAFAPLFIGIAIDFGIQFTVRYSAESAAGDGVGPALGRTAAGVGTPLSVAGAATALGFFSLAPTDYRGVSELGLIAGAGMVIALGLNLTLLPSLLVVFRTGSFRQAGGFPGAVAIEDFLAARRRGVLIIAALAGLACCLALTRLRFDFDPINLENPRSESVRTLADLARDPQSTPYTIDILAPSASAAGTLAGRLQALPEVSQVLWLGTFVPDGQQAKLAILNYAQMLLDPTLNPAQVQAPPTPEQTLQAAAKCAADAGKLGASDPAAAELASALSRAVARGPSVVPALEENISRGAAGRLADMRLALQAGPVSLQTMPEDMRRDWIGQDGQYRLQVFPKASGRDSRALKRFVAAVSKVAPGATGMPVEIEESGRTVLSAFRLAGLLAAAAITALLALVLRRLRDVLAVLAPLLLAGLLTLGTSVPAGLSLNFANIVTLPLLLGIGVAFDIYLVMRWRRGRAHLLRSPTARGVLFSALTTGTAFGSLALSKSPGMADMGTFLCLGLFYTLLCTLLVVPALLGPPRQTPASPPA